MTCRKTLYTLMTPLLLALALVLPLGCGNKTSEPAPAATAEEAVQRVITGFQQNKPVVVWQAMPASYQNDVHSIMHEAIGKIDPKAWESVVDTAKRLHKLLTAKREFIINHPNVAGMLGKESATKLIDGMLPILGDLLDSDLAQYEKARNLDMGQFLDTTGSKIMGRIMDMMKTVPMAQEGPPVAAMADKLKQIKVTRVSGEGEKAVLKLESPGDDPKEMEFVRIEGKWIPKEMADEWSNTMKEAREKLAAMTDKEWSQINAQLNLGTAMLQGMIDPLEKAKTQEEFNTALNALMEMMMGSAGAGPGPGPGIPGPGEDGAPVPPKN